MALFTIEVSVSCKADKKLNKRLKRIEDKLDQLKADSELAQVTREIVNPIMLQVIRDQDYYTPNGNESEGD